jgi:hypothetical protein
MCGIDHPVQMSRGVFDVVVFVLSRSAFSGDHAAAMDIYGGDALETGLRHFIDGKREHYGNS